MDAKVNWNRTSAHQIWGKFSYMNAVVDDLTNYLGPDPNASGDGGFTKVYQATAGQTWTLSPTMLMDMTFGYGRQKQDVLGPDFQAGNYGLDDARHPRHERPGERRPALRGLPAVRHRLQRRRQPRRLEPDLPRRADLHAGHQHEQDEGASRYPRRISDELLLPRSLAARDRQPARAVRLQRRDDGVSTAARRPADNFYNQFASFLLGYVGTAGKSVQNELMTAREWQHSFYLRDRWTPHGASSPSTSACAMRSTRSCIAPTAAASTVSTSTNPDFNRRLDVLIAGRGDNPQNNGM